MTEDPREIDCAETPVEWCFWCSEGRDEMAPPDPETFYDPCPKCNVLLENACFLFEANPTANFEEQPPFLTVFPTGRWATIEEEGIDAIFSEEAAAIIKQANMAPVSSEVWDSLGLSEIKNDPDSPL